MSSSRFPSKMLADLNGLHVVIFMTRRMAACPALNAVIPATTDAPRNEPRSFQNGLDCEVFTADLPRRAFSSLRTVKRLLPMFDALQARAEALSKPYMNLYWI